MMEHHQAQQDAERLWEQTIVAKGGRERLHAVRNMVVSSGGKYGSRRLGKNQVRSESLYVLPNKYWNWIDYRPDVFGLRISMYNYDTGKKYIISDGEANHPVERIERNEDRESRIIGLLSYLLELRGLTPRPLEVGTVRIGSRQVNVVQTSVNGKRVDFALDQETHLPVRVSFHDVIKGKTYITSTDLSDYVEVSGIKVPRKVKYEDGTVYEQSYQFNVKFNEDIFIKPPDIKAGPEAWR
jgi:hypothetical protein